MKTGDRIFCVRKGTQMTHYTIGKEYEVLAGSYGNGTGTISVRNDKGTTFYLNPNNFSLIESLNTKDDYQNF